MLILLCNQICKNLFDVHTSNLIGIVNIHVHKQDDYGYIEDSSNGGPLMALKFFAFLLMLLSDL